MPATEYIYWACQFLVLAAIVGISIVAVFKRQGTEPFLCGDCRFNDQASCHKKERPRALDCTAYRSSQEPGSGYRQ